MLIRFLTSIAGVTWSYNENEVHDIPDEEAQGYLRTGVAESIAPESAVLSAARQAVLPIPNPRKRH